ncbi:unnamed protein product, partial [Trichogramma brassicae]
HERDGGRARVTLYCRRRCCCCTPRRIICFIFWKPSRESVYTVVRCVCGARHPWQRHYQLYREQRRCARSCLIQSFVQTVREWRINTQKTDPCAKLNCSLGSHCVRTPDGEDARCECMDSCPSHGDHDAAGPVCGSDGVDYPSLCDLNRVACSTSTNVSVAFRGKCVYGYVLRLKARQSNATTNSFYCRARVGQMYIHEPPQYVSSVQPLLYILDFTAAIQKSINDQTYILCLIKHLSSTVRLIKRFCKSEAAATRLRRRRRRRRRRIHYCSTTSRPLENQEAVSRLLLTFDPGSRTKQRETEDMPKPTCCGVLVWRCCTPIAISVRGSGMHRARDLPARRSAPAGLPLQRAVRTRARARLRQRRQDLRQRVRESLRRRQVRPAGAVRDRSLRHRQVRVRPRVRGRDAARVRPRRHHLRLALRAQAAGLHYAHQHRARLQRRLRFQRTLLGQGLTNI